LQYDEELDESHFSVSQEDGEGQSNDPHSYNHRSQYNGAARRVRYRPKVGLAKKTGTEEGTPSKISEQGEQMATVASSSSEVKKVEESSCSSTETADAVSQATNQLEQLKL